MAISLARKNLFHEPMRLFISVSGVTFAVFLILLLLALYRGWSETLSEYIYKVDADIWVMQAGTVDMSHSVSLLPNTTQDQLHTIVGVQTVTPLVGNRTTLNIVDQEVTSRIIGVDTEQRIGGPANIVAGTAVIRNGEIVIDQIIQQDEDLTLGQTVTVQDQPFTIVGIASGGPLFQQSYITMTDARELFHLQEYSNYFVVSVSGKMDVTTVIQEIEDTIPGIDAQTTQEFATNNEREIMENFLPIIYVLVFIGFIVGVVIISLTIYTATIEKIREYGVLKAIGASNRYLYQVVITQSGIAGGLGLLLGTVLTYGVSLNIQRLEPLFVTLVKWPDVLSVAGLTGVMVVCAAYIPVRRILGIDPAIVFKA